ncbi:Fe-S cluster assembly sulfur transfer protein SufU [Microbacterium hibisci]|uniref:Fe-S cluster assembly sulfur transfer protein SufU n=1 Tax=Microbacterium hibisci TaxID=2036000 RepID=UPI001940CF79|nr:SUF system NifU family Fe-S cluster assembly protein [Microbacterium hibisci]
MSGLESLYQELILDHSKRPHGKGLGSEEAAADAAGQGGRVATSFQRNPICGDEITLRVRLSDDGTTVDEVAWDGAGCSISQASASMLVALIEEDERMPRAEASALIEGFREALRSRGEIALDEEVFGDAAALSGVSKFTARVKCAMLAWVAFEDAVARA